MVWWGLRTPVSPNIPDDCDASGLWTTLENPALEDFVLLSQSVYINSVQEVNIMYNLFKGLELDCFSVDCSEHILMNHPSPKVVRIVINESIRKLKGKESL